MLEGRLFVISSSSGVTARLHPVSTIPPCVEKRNKGDTGHLASFVFLNSINNAKPKISVSEKFNLLSLN